MKSVTRRITGAGAATVLAVTGLALMASPASATTPTGGCWVYSVAPGRGDRAPAGVRHLGRALAPWTDPAQAPDAGNPPTTCSPPAAAPQVGTTRNLSDDRQQGSQERWPAGQRHRLLLLLGQRREPAAGVPGRSPRRPRPEHPRLTPSPARSRSRAPAPNTVTFRKVIYDIPSFTIAGPVQRSDLGRWQPRRQPDDRPGQHQRGQPRVQRDARRHHRGDQGRHGQGQADRRQDTQGQEAHHHARPPR